MRISQSKYPLDKTKHFKDARLVSYLSDADRPGRKMGAILHRGNKKLAFGINSFIKTHTLQGGGLKTYLHAEVSAAIKRRHYDDLTSCEITIYREVNNMPALAMPCKQCQSILRILGIKKIWYSIPFEPYHDVMIL